MRRLALITGAAKRIGASIAEGLLGAGYDVACCHRGPGTRAAAESLQARWPQGRVDLFEHEFGSNVPATLLMERVTSAMGSPSLVVHCASLFSYDDPRTMSADSVRAHMESNFHAFLELSLALRESTAPARHAIVFLDQKLTNLNVDYASYTISKLCARANVSFLARALAPDIRINAISPGLTLESGPQTPSQFEQARHIAALNRSNNLADLLQAVLYLDQAQSVTGQEIVVDGGQHLIPRSRDVMFPLELS